MGAGYRCLSCPCVFEKRPREALLAQAANDGRALGEAMLANELTARGVRALESIAASLEKLANPPVTVRVRAINRRHEPAGVRSDPPDEVEQ